MTPHDWRPLRPPPAINDVPATFDAWCARCGALRDTVGGGVCVPENSKTLWEDCR